MYGYRKSSNADNGLMTNLNSISSSLSSLDTIGRPSTMTNQKISTNVSKLSSIDNLISSRSHSIASTSLLWPPNRLPNEDRHSGRNGRQSLLDSDSVYYANTNIKRHSSSIKSCFKNSSQITSNFILIPLLLSTILRQVFDFLGQIWLQILVNFFTIILLILALFGIKQNRISYLFVYSSWAIFNTFWNLIVVCIYLKVRPDSLHPFNLQEDTLSLYTGATSWWHSNGPGCLPYNITSIQPSISILQPSIVTGCRIDYHSIESAQAALHGFFSFISTIASCCIIISIHKNQKHINTEKSYRMSTLDRPSKVNQDPYPNHYDNGTLTRYGTGAASLKRISNRTGSRGSQHSLASQRSGTRRRARQPSDSVLPTPRGSTSSIMRSQKYGSLSSRRSSKRERRGDLASLTYGVTGGERANNRSRLSSVSSNDCLPSYQPPHSSNANLLSSYGDVSSIDSYNNTNDQKIRKVRQTSVKSSVRGNANPTYSGSRSSIYSHGNTNNYDNLSYIYGNNNVKNSENLYQASTSSVLESTQQRQQQNQIYQQNRLNSTRSRNNYKRRDPPAVPHEIHAETHQNGQTHFDNDAMTKAKLAMTNGTSFQPFSSANHQQTTSNGESKTNGIDSSRYPEINNNYMTSNYGEKSHYSKRISSNPNGHHQSASNQNKGFSTFDSRSRVEPDKNNMTQDQTIIYSNQRNSRPPIYSNHIPNGNSETPI